VAPLTPEGSEGLMRRILGGFASLLFCVAFGFAYLFVLALPLAALLLILG
jgi:hypothetical protein